MRNPYFNATHLEVLFNTKIINSKSKGIDKISAQQAKDRKLIDFNSLSQKCKNQLYNYTPYLEHLKVKKRDSLPRMISIPCVRDKLTLLALKEFLHNRFSSRINKKLPNNYIRQLKTYIKLNKGKEIFFLKMDVLNFYSEIEHNNLFRELNKKHIPKYVQYLINNAIKNPTVPAGYQRKDLNIYAPSKGVPQGLSISNILAEIYLTDVDSLFRRRKYLYLRYVDDIFILMTSNRIHQIEKSIQLKLDAVNLAPHPDKTSKGKFKIDTGIKFLGYNIFKDKISISYDNFQKVISKITDKLAWLKKGIAEPSFRPTWIKDIKRLKEVFIEEVNEKITGSRNETKNYGWLFYFIETEDVDQLFHLDAIINKLILNSRVFKKPPRIKRFVRAYFEIKYNNGGNYIVNYDKAKTIRQKRLLLLKRGKINPTGFYTDAEIEMEYDRMVRKNISSLEKDINYNYL